MKEHYALSNVSKKQLVDIFDIKKEDAAVVMKYRRSLTVITESDGVEGFCINTRVLHKQLKVNSDYSHWIKRRLKGFEIYDDEENSGDYMKVYELSLIHI